MPKIRIDKESMVVAMEDHSDYMNWYLDKTTGEIVYPSTDDFDDEDELLDEIEEAPDRYLYIEPVSSHEGYNIMELFIESIEDDYARDVLERAISYKKPFSNFKQALIEFPDIRAKWFEFNKKTLLEEAREWLEIEGIDFEFVDNKEPLQ